MGAWVCLCTFMKMNNGNVSQSFFSKDPYTCETGKGYNTRFLTNIFERCQIVKTEEFYV